MRGTALLIGVGMLFVAGCAFDMRGNSSAGGDGDGDGDGDQVVGTDGAPGGPDAGRSGPDAGAPDAQVPSTALVTCARTEVPPALDGAPMGPWADATFTPFAASEAELVADKVPNYSFDAALSFACLHDDENVYFFVDVQDSEVVDNSVALREDDGVVIFLDGSGDRSGTYGEDDHGLMIGAEAESWDYGPGELDPTGVVMSTNDGYHVEIALDKPAIASPLPDELGFNLAIIDDDGMGNSNRDVFALRHVPEPPACDDCCEGQAQPWCDTSVMGTLQLIDP